MNILSIIYESDALFLSAWPLSHQYVFIFDNVVFYTMSTKQRIIYLLWIDDLLWHNSIICAHNV